MNDTTKEQEKKPVILTETVMTIPIWWYDKTVKPPTK